MDNYVLYIHENKSNGKKYIGITSQTPEKRWGSNGKNYHDSPKFWNAIQKYGWDGFNHIIEKSFLSQDEARKLEIEYIDRFNTVEGGYNISSGGDVPPIKYGKDNHNYGGNFSNETRQKMSEHHADFSGGKHPRAKSVLCVETNTVYETITFAANDVKVSRSCIRDVCEGRQSMSAGYHWKYV